MEIKKIIIEQLPIWTARLICKDINIIRVFIVNDKYYLFGLPTVEEDSVDEYEDWDDI